MENPAVNPEQKKKISPAVIAAIVIGALAGAYLALCAFAMNSDTIFPNTYLAGTDINLGGRTVEEAAALLEEHHAALSNGTLTVTWEETGAEVTVPFEELGFYYHPKGTALHLYAAGRENFLTGGAEYLRALLASEVSLTVKPAGVWTEPEFLAAVREIIAVLGTVDPVDFAAEVDGADIVITKSCDGLAVDKPKLYAALEEVLGSAAAAELSFAVDESHCTVLPAEEGDLAALRRSLVGEAVNAVYDHATGGITPSRAGANFTLDELQAAYDAAQPGSTFRFDARITYPEVSTEELEQCLFRDLLSGYTTRVGGAPGRHENVRITAERINGVILNPGETMKYGPLVTPFTAENGYFPAPGYLQGKTVDMVGGGACQASSTLYAATIYANLEIVQRVNHGFASDYIGLGMDATVAEGGPEFEFRNNTLYPIKVEAQFFKKGANDYVRVALHGTKTDDYSVEIDTEILSTTPYGEEYVETDELAPGETKVEQTPYNGYDVKTYRCIYDGDGNLISRTLEARSRYRMRNRIILVGKTPEVAVPEEPVAPPEIVVPEEPAVPVVPQDPAAPYVPPAEAAENSALTVPEEIA